MGIGTSQGRKKIMSSYFGFLYARPSALEGVARLLDFGNSLNEYNVSANGEEADYLALKLDWEAIKEDIRHTVVEFEEAYKEQLANAR
jgi:hypothetical protein